MCFEPLSFNARQLDARILSVVLGREVGLATVTQDSLNSVLRPAALDAFLSHPSELLFLCAWPELRRGWSRLKERNVYVQRKTYVSSVISLVWHPGKTPAATHLFTDWDPMRCGIKVWVQKSVNEAVAELLRDTKRVIVRKKVCTTVFLPTTSYEALANLGYDPADTAVDFRDAIEFDAPKVIPAAWVKLGFYDAKREDKAA